MMYAQSNPGVITNRIETAQKAAKMASVINIAPATDTQQSGLSISSLRVPPLDSVNRPKAIYVQSCSIIEKNIPKLLECGFNYLLINRKLREIFPNGQD
ncbi:TPA: hypothetical protein ACXI1T_003752 [Serratia liquefaciens]